VRRLGPLGRAALELAVWGVPVFPVFAPTGPGRCSCVSADCARPGKHPRVRRGVLEATRDPDQVREWWWRWPGASIGAATGSRFDVCDVDSEAGADAVRRLLAGEAAAGPMVRTGSGGWHLYVAPTGQGNRTGFLPGVDWRGRGGYVIVPPSAHAAGEVYRWVRPLTAERVPPAPAGLLAALAGPAAQRREPVRIAVEVTRYVQVAIDRECHMVAATPAPPAGGRNPAGRGRNDALNRAAFNLGQLVGAGLVDEQTVRGALDDAAGRCGLGVSEAARTIRSGMSAGIAHPRPTRAGGRR